MCDLNQPKPASGPTLCNGAQELVVQRVIAGDRNSDIRALLKKQGHWHDLSDAAFTPYRKLPIVKEARVAAIASVKDVGIVALHRRIDELELLISDIFNKLKKARPKLEPADHANLFRAAVIGCKELSRLVDTLDPDGTDGIPNNSDANAPVSMEQILAAARAFRSRYKADMAAKAAQEAARIEAGDPSPLGEGRNGMNL